MKITVEKALIEQALYVIDAWERDCDYSLYWRDRDNAMNALRAALAEPVGKAVTKINLKGGRYLKFEPCFFFGPMCWRLYSEYGRSLRVLDDYERTLIEAALKASQPTES